MIRWEWIVMTVLLMACVTAMLLAAFTGWPVASVAAAGFALAAFVWFLPWEARALLNEGTGDTYSENVGFRHVNPWVRWGLGVAIAVVAGLNAVDAFRLTGMSETWAWRLGVWLTCALVVWLPAHFGSRGNV